jgi:RNA polymerase primary sigma factor
LKGGTKVAEKDISPAIIDEVKDLVSRGKKEGELTYEEIMDALEDIDLDSEDIEKIYDIFSEMNIEVVNSKLPLS